MDLAITQVVRTKDSNYTEGKKESTDCEGENQLHGVFSLNERRVQTIKHEKLQGAPEMSKLSVFLI